MARLVAFAGIFVLALLHTTMSKTVQEFFPDVKSNLTKIKWAHAVNSKAELETALNSSDIHMIEADVVIGKINNDTPANTPIMAHPPKNMSDLSLEDFLNKVLLNKTKGIKLDFKTTEAFEASLAIIEKKKANLTVPVWLNADILPGPVDASNVTVDPEVFLTKAKQLPETLLSIGWCTSVKETSQNVTTEKYEKSQIEAMVKVLKDNAVNQSVTYPVRAVFAANDIEIFTTLLANTSANNPTLTIWSHDGDKVNVTGLNKLIKTVGLDKVYVDVPESLRKQLVLNGAFSATSSLFAMAASLVATLFAAKFL